MYRQKLLKRQFRSNNPLSKAITQLTRRLEKTEPEITLPDLSQLLQIFHHHPCRILHCQAAPLIQVNGLEMLQPTWMRRLAAETRIQS